MQCDFPVSFNSWVMFKLCFCWCSFLFFFPLCGLSWGAKSAVYETWWSLRLGPFLLWALCAILMGFSILFDPPRHAPSSLVISFLLCLLICGDIESNPGPGLDVCHVCDSEVANNHHGLFCEVCSNWSHRSCVKMSVDEYFHWANIEDGWICSQCEKEAFPFYDASLLSSCSSHSDLSKSDSVNTTP